MIRLLRELLLAAEEVADSDTTVATPARLQAEMLLEETRDELIRADTKASILLSASGVVVAALLAGAMSQDWDPSNLSAGPAQAMFWIGIVVAAGGVLALALAVKPRTKHTGDREGLAYFGHVVRYRSSGWFRRSSTRIRENTAGKEMLLKDLEQIGDDTFGRVVDQVWVLSGIVHLKYRLIQLALLSFGGAVLFCAIAALADAWVL